MRRTNATVAVMAALMDDPTDRHWGYQLSKQAGIRSGVLYPVLHRMLDDQFLEDGWENPDEISGRPPRRYYKLTGAGINHFRSELDAVATDQRFVGIFGTATA